MDEFEIIRQYFDRAKPGDDVIAGIGDDGAVTRPEAGRDLVTVIDTLVAGVHFPETLPPVDIGYRAVAVNLSDIAAMAATPRWMTLALTLADAEPAWLDDFARGLYLAADEYGVTLVGGDTTRGSELVVTVQITGDVGMGEGLLRSGASVGDSIYVTGTLGDAAAGLSVLQSGAPQTVAVDYLVRRFSRPQARVELAQAIAPIASAAIDLSDGLYTDTEKLLAASRVAGCIEVNQVPLSSELQSIVSIDDARRFALGGGDDYELCFTTAAKEDDVNEIAANIDAAVSRIGVVTAGDGLTCTLDGSSFNYHDHGYRHFG